MHALLRFFLWKNEAITCWLISVSGQGNVNIDRNKNGKKKIDKWIGLIGLFEQIGKKAWLDSLDKLDRMDRLGRSGHEIE